MRWRMSSRTRIAMSRASTLSRAGCHGGSGERSSRNRSAVGVMTYGSTGGRKCCGERGNMTEKELQERLDAALRALDEVLATRQAVDPDRTLSMTSVPGNAWDVILQDRDVWKGRALRAEEELAATLNRVHWGPGWD